MPRPPDSAGRAKVYTIAAGAPFSATLARGILQRFGGGAQERNPEKCEAVFRPIARQQKKEERNRDPKIADFALTLADTTIYLPTRRAARSIAEVFAREAGGATLLPAFRALGEVDEDELLLESAGALELKPAITPLRRRLLLAALVRRWSHARDGGSMRFSQAAALAKSLAAVMDETETQGADLGKLKDLAPLALAGHWEAVRDFLLLIRTQWPALLEAEGCINPAAHRNEALSALARRLHDNPPDRPVIAAGSTGSIPATADLLGVIARLPKGAVVLPGLDRDLDAGSWERLEPGHPQFTLKQLLEHIGVARVAVEDWTDDTGLPDREKLLREVLRPAPTTDAWRALAESGDTPSVDGLSLYEAADPGEEAAAVALMLREVLETPDTTAALVTRDRALARRVTAELGRWHIAIDDSAGRPLSHTAAGSFLCQLAQAADEDFAPVPLLALLKHPLAGEDAAFRARARELDLRLRGPRPDGGLQGIAAALEKAPKDLQDWFARVADALSPLEAMLAQPEVKLPDVLAAHVAAAEALASTLWNGPDGKAAARFVQELQLAAGGLPDIEARTYAPFFRALSGEVPVRPPYGRHPRLAILGPLEARLQRFDLVILGGLNEGAWPASVADDPWFSRPMRATLGLEQPERAIGLSAHDFASLAAGPKVVLTRALKSEGTPTVASRWIQRLVQLARGLGSEEALKAPARYRKIVAAMADPGPAAPEKPPRPTPPVEARPRSLTVTEIETWVRDPYAIYARRVLKLEKLDPLDAELGALERGSALHDVLERFVKTFPHGLPADAARELVAIADAVFREMAIPNAVLALWRPRLRRIAPWFVREEERRRDDIAGRFTEVSGALPFKGPAGEFTLRGRADRIDRLKAGGGAILDYKTGAPPSEKQVKAHLAPQLPLEGAMLAAGAFKEAGKLKPADLIYVRIGGSGEKPGEFKPIKADAQTLAQEAAARLAARIALFDRVDTAYDSRVGPQFARFTGDYDHLARVREWSASGWHGESE